MVVQIPPPLRKRRRNGLPLPVTILLVGGILAGLCVLGLIGLRILGLLIPYSVPSDGMSPAVSRGDSILMESISYRNRKPLRGEILVFRTDGLPLVPKRQVYLKRLVGLPGDNISIVEGAVFVNGVRTAFRNLSGEIAYTNHPAAKYLLKSGDSVTVPEGHYFVLGDNSQHSSDSRFWGYLPERAVIGRVVCCYWPPQHVGAVQ